MLTGGGFNMKKVLLQTCASDFQLEVLLRKQVEYFLMKVTKFKDRLYESGLSLQEGNGLLW